MSAKHTIILAGSGRSGTTWLGNIIAAGPTVGTIFEPFDRRRVPEASPFSLRPYARPYRRYPEWEAVAGRILRGEIRNEWINREGRTRWERKRLVKDIRANLLLGWLSETFDPHIVYMIRHPCAVVLSRIKLNWETHLDCYLEQDELIEDYLEPYLDVIEGAKTAVARHTVMWCVENLVPLQQMAEYDWIFCTYEHLCTAPQRESRRILKRLGLRDSFFTRRATQRISSVTRQGSWVNNQRNPMMEWKQELTSGQTQSILNIVRRFDIDLYDESAMPHLERSQKGLFQEL